MRKKQVALLVFGIVFVLSTAGCVAVAAGAGAAGGYTAGKYQVRGDVRGSYEAVWDTTLALLKREGSAVTTDDGKGIVKAVVETSQVHILPRANADLCIGRVLLLEADLNL